MRRQAGPRQARPPTRTPPHARTSIHAASPSPSDVSRSTHAPASCPPADWVPACCRGHRRGRGRWMPGWVVAVLASEGARVVPLGPGEGRGWGHRLRGVEPDAPDGRACRRRICRSRARRALSGPGHHARSITAWVGDVVASSRRDLVISVALPDTAGRVARVDLYRDPPGMPVLTAELAP